MQITESGRMLNAGVVGLGNRGQGQLELIHGMADVKILAVCDKYQDRMENGLRVVPDAKGTLDYHDILAMPEVEVLFIFTDWLSHIPIAIEAMKAGMLMGDDVGPRREFIEKNAIYANVDA